MARMTTKKPDEHVVPGTPDAPAATESPDAQALRKRLISRVAAAAVLIVALLSVLAVFDKLNEPPPKVATSVASAPAAPEAGVSEPQAAAPTPEVKAPETPPEEPRKVEEAVAEPETTTAPTTPTPKAERPLTKPATGRLAMQKRSEPVAAARPSHPAAQLAQPLSQPSRPLTRAAEAFRSYVLQLGVFNNTANAEELRAKLELNGIPSQIEARVQVGPFKTRQEAEAAREKLKALGMESGVLVAVKK